MTISRLTNYAAQGGIFTLDDWQVTGKPESNVTIIVWTDAVDLNKAKKANDNAIYAD